MKQYTVSVIKNYEVEANTEREAVEIAKTQYFKETGVAYDEIEVYEEANLD